MTSASAPLTARSMAAYGAMALPLAFAGLPVYLHAPDFYATDLGVSLAALGTVLLGLRLIDAVQDPFIGSLSDRWSSHRGLILWIGALMLGGGFWMVFTPMGSAPLLWFAAAVLLCTTGFSVVSINLQALGGLWHASDADRTRIASWREGFGLLGLLLAAMAPTVLAFGDPRAVAFERLALLYLPLLALGLLLLLRWLRRAQLDAPAADEAGVGWREVLAGRWRRQFFGLYLANTVAGSIPAVLVMFFIRDRIGAEAQTGLFLLAYFLSGALSMALWPRIAARFGKPQAWALSMGLAIATFVWASLLGPGDVTAYAVVCILSGLALGADLALPAAILADHIARDRAQDAASRLYSVMTFVSKAALALATGLVLPTLGLLGYVPGSALTETGGLLLSLAYAALPCLLKAVTLVWLLKMMPVLAPAPLAPDAAAGVDGVPGSGRPAL
ncbi:MFS transporter [Pannonibacter tanglangensis]|nr:MFS transporter [Pannonibacter sp. XCT-53]